MMISPSYAIVERESYCVLVVLNIFGIVYYCDDDNNTSPVLMNGCSMLMSCVSYQCVPEAVALLFWSRSLPVQENCVALTSNDPVVTEDVVGCWPGYVWYCVVQLMKKAWWPSLITILSIWRRNEEEKIINKLLMNDEENDIISMAILIMKERKS